MRVVMMSVAASPSGTAGVGRVVDVSNELGKQWVESRYARPFNAETDAKRPVGFEKASEDK